MGVGEDDGLSKEDVVERDHTEDDDSSRQKFKSGIRRPIGQKRAKQMAKLEEARQKKLQIAAEAVCSQRARNEALERHNELLLFSSAPEECNHAETIEYYNVPRAEALQKTRSRLADDSEACGSILPSATLPCANDATVFDVVHSPGNDTRSGHQQTVNIQNRGSLHDSRGGP